MCGACVRRRRPWIGRAGLPSLGQWVGVYGSTGSKLAQASGSEDALHPTRESLGERLQRELSWGALRRVARPGDLLHLAGSEGVNRAVEATLQQGSSSQCSWLSSTGTGGHGNPAAGREAAASRPRDRITAELTYELVQSPGAGHLCRFMHQCHLMMQKSSARERL